jgi:hypothetical protein
VAAIRGKSPGSDSFIVEDPQPESEIVPSRRLYQGSLAFGPFRRLWNWNAWCRHWSRTEIRDADWRKRQRSLIAAFRRPPKASTPSTPIITVSLLFPLRPGTPSSHTLRPAYETLILKKEIPGRRRASCHRHQFHARMFQSLTNAHARVVSPSDPHPTGTLPTSTNGSPVYIPRQPPPPSLWTLVSESLFCRSQ